MPVSVSVPVSRTNKLPSLNGYKTSKQKEDQDIGKDTHIFFSCGDIHPKLDLGIGPMT